MANKEDFSKNLKTMSREEIEAQLLKPTPEKMVEAAIAILGQMEKNFGEALKLKYPYDGKVKTAPEKAFTEFEKAYLRLKEQAQQGAFDLTVDLAIGAAAAGLAGLSDEEFAAMRMEELTDKLATFLLKTQTQAKSSIKQSFASPETTPEKRVEAFQKQEVEEEFRRLENDFHISSIFCWSNELPDWGELLKALPKIRKALNALKTGEKDLLEKTNTRIVIGKRDGLEYPTQGEVVLAIDFTKSLSDCAVALEKSMKDLWFYTEAKEKMRKLAQEGLNGQGMVLSWSQKQYDWEKLNIAAEKLLEAYEKLSPKEKELLKKYTPNIVLGMQNGIVHNSSYLEMIGLNYMDTDSFLQALKEGIHQYRCFIDVQNKLKELNGQYGAIEIGLWSNVIYNYDEVSRHLVDFQRALEQLSEEDLKLLKSHKTRIILGNNEYGNGLTNSREGNAIIALYYKWPYVKMAETLASCLKTIEDATLIADQNAKPKIEEFLQDPLLKDLRDFAIPQEFVDLYPGGEKELKFAVLRNLNKQKLPLNHQNILQEIQRICSVIEAYGSMDFFKGRHVLIITHNEVFRDQKEDESSGRKYTEEDYGRYEAASGGKWRFGCKHLRDEIEKSAAEIEIIRASRASVEEFAKAKDNILNAIRFTSPPPALTTLIHGHGGDEEFYLMDKDAMVAQFGQEQANKFVSERKDRISAKEFAEAIIDRINNFPQLATNGPEEKDVIIIACCDSARIVRKISEILDSKGIDSPALPLLVSSAEYKQYGFSHFADKYGSAFFSKVLRLGSGEPVSVNNILRNQKHGASNPTVIAPGLSPKMPNGQRYLQVGQNDNLPPRRSSTA